MSFKSVCQTTAGLAMTALAAQGDAHPLDGAERVPKSRGIHSHPRPYLHGDWRPMNSSANLNTQVQGQAIHIAPPAGRTNITQAVKQPAGTGGLVTIPLTGCSENDYMGPMIVGSKNATFQVIIDSGSTTAAVAGTECTTCKTRTPKFTPDSSTEDTGFPVNAAYGMGSWEGEAYSGSVRLGNGPATTVQFGDIQDQTQWFSGGDCRSDGDATDYAWNQGIMGVGPASGALEGTSAYFDSIADSLPAYQYSVALCDQGGTLWLGGYNKAAINGSMAILPMTASGYYAVDMTGIQVGGQDIGMQDTDFGASVVDTGTTQMLLPTAAFEAAVKLIVAGSGNRLDKAFFDNSTSCIVLPQGVSFDEVDRELPSLTLSFGNNDAISSSGGYGGGYGDYFTADVEEDYGDIPYIWDDAPPPPYGSSGAPSPAGSGSGSGSVATLTFPATNSYLLPMLTTQGKFAVCSGLGNAGNLDLTILGNTLMHNSVVMFDVKNQQIGWALGQGTCA